MGLIDYRKWQWRSGQKRAAGSVEEIDHVAFPVNDLDRSLEFFIRVLGARCMREPYRIGGEILVQQICVGKAALSLHRKDNGLALAASAAAPGTLDICFSWSSAISNAVAHLQMEGVEIVEGPVARSSAEGRPAKSVYFRDPDGNLIELLSSES